jgi:hypothetical protein
VADSGFEPATDRVMVSEIAARSKTVNATSDVSYRWSRLSACSSDRDARGVQGPVGSAHHRQCDVRPVPPVHRKRRRDISHQAVGGYARASDLKRRSEDQPRRRLCTGRSRPWPRARFPPIAQQRSTHSSCRSLNRLAARSGTRSLRHTLGRCWLRSRMRVFGAILRTA